MSENENEVAEENSPDSVSEYAGLTKNMVLAGVLHLLLDIVLVFVLWNVALVGSIDGVHKINPLVAAGLVFLVRAIGRG